MTGTFRAVVLTKDDSGIKAALTMADDSALMDGDVTLSVTHSTVNYKDGLALAGSPVVRRFPMIPGIDLCGVVETSTHASWKKGDVAVLNGWGVGEVHTGGYAARARLKGDWLIPLPAPFTPSESMAIGTAGYTAALAMRAILDRGIAPSAGALLVTGAAGGVGSVAVALAKANGFHVIASTGRESEAAYLRSLGADEIIARAELAGEGRPLGKERWAAAIDSVGSRTLANILAQTRYGGVVAACGLAGGNDLPATVLPFILRGVTLAGIDSVMAPREQRLKAWALLASHLDRTKLAAMTTTIPLAGVFDAGKAILKGEVRGRLVVDVRA